MTIPDDLTKIEAYAFANCSSLTSFVVSNSVTMVDYSAFSGASNLTSLTIGSGLNVITSSAFSDMTGLTDLVIPNTVTWIDAYAFSGCTNLMTVSLEGYVPMIIYSNTFSFSSLDAKIFVPTESFIKYLVEDSWSDYTKFLTDLA